MIIQSKPLIDIWYTAETEWLSDIQGFIAFDISGHQVMIGTSMHDGFILTSTHPNVYSSIRNFQGAVELRIAQDQQRGWPVSINITFEKSINEFLNVPSHLPMRFIHSHAERDFLSHGCWNLSMGRWDWCLYNKAVTPFLEKMNDTAKIIKRVFAYWDPLNAFRPNAIDTLFPEGGYQLVHLDEDGFKKAAAFLEDYEPRKSLFNEFLQVKNFDVSRHLEIFNWMLQAQRGSIGGLEFIKDRSWISITISGCFRFTLPIRTVDWSYDQHKIYAFILFYLKVTGRHDRFIAALSRRRLKK